jgi:two-component system sensor histidine kinase KdpD
MDEDFRRDPEQLLKQAELEERRKRRGRLKIFLGYASGVGKSEQMLDEGRRRRERGQDVVVAAVQARQSPDIEQLLRQHEIIPTLSVAGRDVIDLAQIYRRHPQVVLIDGLAYDNPAGSKHEKRWQDIEELLESGISVLASLNTQYVTELQDEVESITGRRSNESVPRSFLEKADEIEIVDVPAHESFMRTQHGALDGVEASEENKLSKLREITMLLAAGVIDTQLQTYLQAHGIQEIWGTQERILVCITPRSNARQMLESGRRNADRFHGELIAVYVRQANLSSKDEAAVEEKLLIAREIGARIEVLEGHDYVGTLIHYAREHGVTQIFIGHSMREGWWYRLRGNPVERLIEKAAGIDVRVFPQGIKE